MIVQVDDLQVKLLVPSEMVPNTLYRIKSHKGDSEYEGMIVVKSYTSMVSLTDTKSAWDNLKALDKTVVLEQLPKGAQVILTQT